MPVWRYMTHFYFLYRSNLLHQTLFIMGKVEVDEVAINLRLLKLCRFYHMFDPNSAKFLNLNVYRFLCIVFTAVIMCILLLGHVEMFINKNDTLSDIDSLKLMFTNIHYYLCVVKISVFLYKENTVWDLFDISRLDFFKSKMCRKNINMLYDCRDWIIKATNYFIFIILVLCIQWMLIPLVMNAFDDTVNIRNGNIIIICFPVSIQIYNQYYFILNVIELLLVFFSGYTVIIIDILIMSFCWIIIILYQILTESFADVGYANKPKSGKKKYCVNDSNIMMVMMMMIIFFTYILHILHIFVDHIWA